MKRSLVLLASTALVLCIPFVAFGATFRAGETSITPEGGRIDDDLYIFGETVSVKGAVYGDVYGAGSNMYLAGSTSGDFVAAGGNVHVGGSVSDDLRVAGGTVVIDGFVGDDAVIAGGDVSFPNGQVTGDLTVAGGTIRLIGDVGRNLTIRGGDVVIDGLVGGNVHIIAEKITLGSNANIRGSLTYKSPAMATMQPGSAVQGKVDFIETKGKDGKRTQAFAALFTVFALLKLATLIVGSLILAVFLKRYANAIAHHVHTNPALEIFRGFAVMVILPILSVLLFFTVIGIPFGIIGLLSFVILIIMGCLLAPIAIAGFLEGRHTTGKWHAITKRSVVFGAFLYWLIGIIPVIGFFVQMALAFAALGATFKIKWHTIKDWR